MQSWYLIYTKPQQEKLALENLERQGYEAYLPMYRRHARRRGRYGARVEPMFPRYLFIYLSDETDNWAPIRSTIGVANLVRFGDIPARVPDDLVEGFRQREDEVGIQDLPTPEFKSGDKVRICEGAMAGYEAIFEAKSSQERVIILLDLVGKQARVKLPVDHLESA